MSAVVLGAMPIVGVLFVEDGKSTSLSMRYFTTVSQQMLTAMKHVANESFVFQQDRALAHHACNTVQLLESETLNFTHFDYALPSTA